MKTLIAFLLSFVFALGACSRSGDKVAIEKGNAALKKSDQVIADLRNYKVYINQTSPEAQGLNLKSNAQTFNWAGMSKADRQHVKENLKELLSLSDKVLEIDARKSVYLTHREEFVLRRDVALTYLESLEKFEKGE